MEFIDKNVLKEDFVEFPRELSSMAYLYEYIAQADVSAVLLISVKDFRYINSCYGHELGDYLLKHIGNELFMRTVDCGKVFRLGGDNFAVLVENCTGSEILKKNTAVHEKD
jgi:diguanylate cyclase (GGDEF)-like protein